MTTLLVIIFLATLTGIFKPYIKDAKRWHFGLAAFVTFVLIGVTADPQPKGSTTSDIREENMPSTDGPSPALPKEVVKDVAVEPTGDWIYSEDKDEMRGAVTRYAQLDATNTIDLDFPYGEQRGKILVRQSPKFGFDILVGVRSGQIMCNSYSNSHINVKFDDGAIQRFGCNDASDGSNNMVFIEGAKGFLAQLKKSKKAVIETEFFQNGMQQMTFNTANLKWEK